MRYSLIQLFSVIILLFSLLLGCTSNQETTKVKPHPKVLSDQKNVSNTPKVDGTIISMKKIAVPNLDSSLQGYRMMYWSAGTKTEAYVAAPKGPGTFPLWVGCHGGWTIPLEKSHIMEMPNGPEMLHFDESQIQSAWRNWITLVVMYRGYGHSDGKVNGVSDNTLDTENAIKAVETYFASKKETRHVSDSMSLFGTSMGGTVVLKVAAAHNDVKSVVALSPFVGWNLFDAWAKQHSDDRKWFNFYYAGVKAYGEFDPTSPTYLKESVPYEKIMAPTILIQGTGDETVPWQTVQDLYNKMKANHQDVTLKIVDGGDHALTNKRDILNQILNEWFSKHY